ALQKQVQDLKWLGLNWDEGPEAESLKDAGPNGPYRQSQRKGLYMQHAQRLLEQGQAYYCFMTEQEIEEQKKSLEAQGQPPHIQSPYRDWSLEKAQDKLNAGTPAVVRFKVADKKRS